MPAMRDWECECGEHGELLISDPMTPYPSEFRHTCGKQARLVWKSFGPRGRTGGDKGRYPYFDIGLGTTVHSTMERDRIAKERGLVIVSKQEFTKGYETSTEPDEMGWDKAAWHDAAQKAYNDIRYGNVPEPKLTTMDDVQADLIDTGKTTA